MPFGIAIAPIYIAYLYIAVRAKRIPYRERYVQPFVVSVIIGTRVLPIKIFLALYCFILFLFLA